MSESKDEYKYIRISKEEDRCMIAQILAKEGYTVKFERKKLRRRQEHIHTSFVTKKNNWQWRIGICNGIKIHN